ncbi:unnamed protein product [Caretta caretta]
MALDFTMASQKVRKLLRYLGSVAPAAYKPSQVSVDAISTVLTANSHVSMDKYTRRQVHKELYHTLNQRQLSSPLSVPYTVDEVDKSLFNTKSGKLAGMDKKYSEFLKNLV